MGAPKHLEKVTKVRPCARFHAQAKPSTLNLRPVCDRAFFEHFYLAIQEKLNWDTYCAIFVYNLVKQCHWRFSKKLVQLCCCLYAT